MSRFRLPCAVGFRLLTLGWVCVAAATLGTSAAEANSGAVARRGDSRGVLIAEKSSAIAIVHEDLVFDMPPRLYEAKVTATYQMVNTGSSRVEIETAFAFVLGRLWKRPGLDAPHGVPPANITLDGEPLTYSVQMDADAALAKVREWLSAHPAIEEEARRLAAAHDRRERGHLLELVASAGVTCGPVDFALIAACVRPTLREVKRGRDSIIKQARCLIPEEELRTIKKGWSTLDNDEPMGWFLFDLAFDPGQTRVLRVEYEHLPRWDIQPRVNPVYTYDYLLSPAKTWASFGSLDVELRAPQDVHLKSTLPMHWIDGAWRLRASGLPDSELSIEVISDEGLWFGMTQRSSYWAIAVIGMALVSTLTGALAARLARSSRRRTLTAAMVLGSGIVGAGVAMAALWGLQRGFPERALSWYEGTLYHDPSHSELADNLPSMLVDYGYPTLLGAFLAVTAFGPLAALVATVSTVLRRRRCGQGPSLRRKRATV